MKSILSLAALFLVLLLCSLAAAGPAKDKADPGMIIGQMLADDGTPLESGVVSFFAVGYGPPVDQGIVRRIPDYVVRISGDGMFKAQLPAGSYYIGALQREWGEGPGPPRPGEKFLFVLDSGNALRVFDIKQGEIMSAGDLSGGIPDTALKAAEMFSAEGKVTYEDGRPFTGALVTVKELQSSTRPLFISEPTGADGSYRIKLPPGSYYFVALESIHGGRPGPGTLLGGYGGKPPVKEPGEKDIYLPIESGKKDGYIDGLAVSGKAGETVKGINIILYTMPDPAKVRTDRREEAKALSAPEQNKSPQQKE